MFRVIIDLSRRFGMNGLWLALALVLSAGALLTWWTARSADRDMRVDLLRNTHLVANAVNLKSITALSGTEADLTSPHYLRLKDQLAAARQAFPNSRFLYLMGQMPDGAIFFFADSEPAGSEDESPAGQIYKEASKVTQWVFSSGSAQTDGPTTDRWGTWVSAHVPLTDPNTGKLLAVIGMDIDAGDWQAHVIRKMLVPIVFTLAMALVVLAAAALFLWRRRLPAERQSEWLPRHAEAVITAAAGLALTFIISYEIHNLEERARQETFSRIATAKASFVTEAIRDVRSHQLEGLARFFESSIYVDRREFQVYAGYLTDDPAVQAWQWIPAVAAKDRLRLEEEARRDGLAEFVIWEKNAEGRKTAASARETYYPVFYTEPLAGNEVAIGYDLGSEPKRRAAIETAAQSGLITATDPVTLVQKAGTPGILVFRPVFNKCNPLQYFSTETQR